MEDSGEEILFVKRVNNPACHSNTELFTIQIAARTLQKTSFRLIISLFCRNNWIDSVLTWKPSVLIVGTSLTRVGQFQGQAIKFFGVILCTAVPHYSGISISFVADKYIPVKKSIICVSNDYDRGLLQALDMSVTWTWTSPRRHENSMEKPGRQILKSHHTASYSSFQVIVASFQVIIESTPALLCSPS